MHGVFGIKVLFDERFILAAIGSRYEQYVVTLFVLGQPIVEIIQGIYAFGKDNQLACRVGAGVEELGHSRDEEGVLGVIMLFLPLLVQVFQYLLVVMEHGKELRLESIGREDNLFCQITFCNGMFNNLVQLHSLNLQFLHL